jgi:beta-lactamase superfamily II metal-dependent hydrolase
MGNVKMRVWDVKHGNAIYIRTPNDRTMVFDLGRGDYSENSDERSPLETLRDHYKVKTIDYLMISHPHKDHIDDILNIGDFQVSSLHRPRVDKNTVLSMVSDRDRPKFEKYFELDEKFTSPSTGGRNDLAIPENFGGMSFQHFSTPSLQGNLNNLSLLMVITYEGIKVIIPGDNEYESLELMMQGDAFKNAIQDCDILIAPHHGRESAYHKEFLTLANPRLTIISDGSICDTSANPKYSANSRGWKVYKNNQPQDRKLLTTNCDGEVYIDFGRNSTNKFIHVAIK